MARIGTWQEALRDGIIADTDDLPEFVTGNVLLVTGPQAEAKDLDKEVQQAAACCDGLVLLIFNRSGKNPDVETDLRMSVTLDMELYAHPYKRDLTRNPSLRSPDDLLEAVMKWLHHRVLSPGSGHCHDETQVAGFNELPDPDFHVFRINVTRAIQF